MCRPPDIVPQIPAARRVQQGDGQQGSLAARLNGFAANVSNTNSVNGWDWRDLVASDGTQQDGMRMTAAAKT